jgi:hypothetical protein
MNLYIVNHIFSSVQRRKESIRNGILPNGRKEGKEAKYYNELFYFRKNGEIYFATCAGHLTEIKFFHKSSNLSLSLHTISTEKYTFDTCVGRNMQEQTLKCCKTKIKQSFGFQKVLNKYDLDKVHCYPKKNFVKRILTSTFVDSIFH